MTAIELNKTIAESPAVRNACASAIEKQIANLQAALNELQERSKGFSNGAKSGVSEPKKKATKPRVKGVKDKDGNSLNADGSKRAPRGSHTKMVLKVLKSCADGMTIAAIGKVASSDYGYSFGGSLNTTVQVLKKKGILIGTKRKDEQAHTFSLASE